MKIDGTFNLKKVGRIFTGMTPWEDQVYHKIGDILVCGERKWRISGVNSIHQGCFGTPEQRKYAILLEPIDHDHMPALGDELIKETEINDNTPTLI